MSGYEERATFADDFVANGGDVEKLIYENTRLENALIALQADYEELASGVGTLRQIIHHLLYDTQYGRGWFERNEFDTRIYDAIAAEFDSGVGES